MAEGETPDKKLVRSLYFPFAMAVLNMSIDLELIFAWWKEFVLTAMQITLVGRGADCRDTANELPRHKLRVNVHSNCIAM
jgi:hypothetical protein